MRWVRRAGPGLAIIAVLVHIHARGPGIDYIGVLAASFASWVGLPGPGVAALVAAGISAGHHRLCVVPVPYSFEPTQNAIEDFSEPASC